MDWEINVAQEYDISLMLYQDNETAMIIEKKGRSTLGKWSQAIDVRFFAIKESVEKKDLKIEHCPTDLMVRDFLPSLLKVLIFDASGI